MNFIILYYYQEFLNSTQYINLLSLFLSTLFRLFRLMTSEPEKGSHFKIVFFSFWSIKERKTTLILMITKFKYPWEERPVHSSDEELQLA